MERPTLKLPKGKKPGSRLFSSRQAAEESTATQKRDQADRSGQPGKPPAPGAGDDVRAVHAIAELHQKLLERIEARVVGQRAVVEQLLTTLFAGGHAIFVGVPGLGKTLLVHSLADAMALDFGRIQFTPDLMPADVTGSEILDHSEEGRRHFRFVPGPVFCNLLLADEINRTPPKTQAALLQAMQEATVSAGGKTHPLPRPFHVFATRNPIEQEGTYALPEAQLDRFMLQIRVDYPDEQAERQILALPDYEEQEPLPPLVDAVELQEYQKLIRRIPVPSNIVESIVRIVRSTRPQDESCPAELREELTWGAGPRAAQQLARASQAYAALQGQFAVRLEDVKTLAPAVLEHRIVPSYQAYSKGRDPAQLVRELVAKALQN